MKSHPVARFRPRERGFTLIELIVVLVILGILAAFAIPRFVGVNKDAREAALKGLAGSLRSSSALVHGLSLARGQTSGTIPLEGTTVNLLNGYPDGSAAGIGATVLNLDGYTANYTGASTAATFVPKGYTDTTGNCTVTYTPAANATDSAVVTISGTPNCG